MKTRTTARLGLLLALLALAPDAPSGGRVGTAYRVPYRLTNTNHYLVRVKLNGKGPFNFLVDTGAPALYVGTAAAKAIGLEPSRRDFWTDVGRLDIEGGAVLEHVRARVEDPFQLTGMNALGLPGATIDGILGYTILARFRLEFDATDDRMTWTLLDFAPKEPPLARGADRDLPADLQMMNALGPIAKLLSPFFKQPEERLRPRGFLGMELAEVGGRLRVASVLKGSPAAEAGVKVGDRPVKVRGQDVATVEDVRKAVARVEAGAGVELAVRRGPGTTTLTITAGEGF